MQKIAKIILVFLITSLFGLNSSCVIQAEEVNCVTDDYSTRTAYVDMSFVSPLTLSITEDEMNCKPDYYYAAIAFNILNERIAMDPMYRNCNEVIVTINKINSTKDVMMTIFEPKAQTGYLNLLSKETDKCYKIDQVTIHIQR